MHGWRARVRAELRRSVTRRTPRSGRYGVPDRRNRPASESAPASGAGLSPPAASPSAATESAPCEAVEPARCRRCRMRAAAVAASLPRYPMRVSAVRASRAAGPPTSPRRRAAMRCAPHRPRSRSTSSKASSASGADAISGAARKRDGRGPRREDGHVHDGRVVRSFRERDPDVHEDQPRLREEDEDRSRRDQREDADCAAGREVCRQEAHRRPRGRARQRRNRGRDQRVLSEEGESGGGGSRDTGHHPAERERDRSGNEHGALGCNRHARARRGEPDRGPRIRAHAPVYLPPQWRRCGDLVTDRKLAAIGALGFVVEPLAR